MNLDDEYKQQFFYLSKCVDDRSLPILGEIVDGKLVEAKKTKEYIVYDKKEQEKQKRKLSKLSRDEINRLYEEQKQIKDIYMEALRQAAEVKKQAELKHYNRCYLATKENYKHWAIQRTWTAAEGVLLILGKNPQKDITEKLLYEVKATFISPPRGIFGISIPPILLDKFEERYNTAKRYVAAGDLPDPVSPLAFLKWAKERGYEIPSELLCALEEAGHRLVDWESLFHKCKPLLNEAINKMGLLEEENMLLKNENEKLKMQLPEVIGGDHPLFSEELDAANIIYRAFINRSNDSLSTGTACKTIIRDLIEELYPKFSDTAKERIATVVNPNKGGGRPKESL